MNGWISVKDRLPENEDTILFCDGKKIDIGICLEGGFRSYSEFGYTYRAGEITHWMPPPELPEVEE